MEASPRYAWIESVAGPGHAASVSPIAAAPATLGLGLHAVLDPGLSREEAEAVGDVLPLEHPHHFGLEDVAADHR